MLAVAESITVPQENDQARPEDEAPVEAPKAEESAAAAMPTSAVAFQEELLSAEVAPSTATSGLSNEGEEKTEQPIEGRAEGSQGNSDGIMEPADMDVLCGRGAAINAHLGNKKFRALCFSRKPEFDAGNHAVKKRVATEVVRVAMNEWGSRFLKKSKDKGPWNEMTTEQAILKASQIMRDFRRPDRVAQREANSTGKKKQYRNSATPMDDIVIPDAPLEPIIENPFGVHDHDVLCGRGAYVNGHVGNQRLRDLALERKSQFERGNYSEKRGLATEIITIIRSLQPPGRFLQRSTCQSHADDGDNSTFVWEELTDEKAIHKSCQVMRDIDRHDRKYRLIRRQQRELRKLRQNGESTGVVADSGDSHYTSRLPDGSKVTIDAVDEAVAAAEEIMEKALEEVKTSTETKAATTHGELGDDDVEMHECV